jgi:hypothetical protein
VSKAKVNLKECWECIVACILLLISKYLDMLFDVEPQLLFNSYRYPLFCFVQEWLLKIAAGKIVTAEDRDVAAEAKTLLAKL